MAKLNEPVSVGVGIIVWNDDGEFLVAQRTAEKHGKGELGLPGGACDPGEDPAWSAIRELHEETGMVAYLLKEVDVTTYVRFEDYDEHWLVKFYECYANGQEPKNKELHKQGPWQWVSDVHPDGLFCRSEEAVAVADGITFA